MRSEPEILLEKHLDELGLSFRREWRFHPLRLWRFDFALGSYPARPQLGDAWKPSKVAIEIEGGIYVRGRHTRGTGFQKDLDKYNAATALGWKVYRFSSNDVLQGRAKDFLKLHLLKQG